MPATPIYDTLSAFAPNVPYNLVAWDPPNTPLSTPTSVATAIVTYLVIIFGGRAFMKGRAPMELRIPFLLHNLALTAGSAALLACMLEEIIPIWHGRGFYYAICGEGAWTMVSAIHKGGTMYAGRRVDQWAQRTVGGGNEDTEKLLLLCSANTLNSASRRSTSSTTSSNSA